MGGRQRQTAPGATRPGLRLDRRTLYVAAATAGVVIVSVVLALVLAGGR